MRRGHSVHATVYRPISSPHDRAGPGASASAICETAEIISHLANVRFPVSRHLRAGAISKLINDRPMCFGDMLHDSTSWTGSPRGKRPRTLSQLCRFLTEIALHPARGCTAVSHALGDDNTGYRLPLYAACRKLYGSVVQILVRLSHGRCLLPEALRRLAAGL